MEVIIGIDIGGSHVGYGFISKSNDELLQYYDEPLDNSSSASEIVLKISSSINEFMKTQKNRHWRIVAVGIGCPGQSKDGILIAASNLPDFKNVPLAKMFSEKLDNAPTILLNDADAAIAAEVWSEGTQKYYLGRKNVAMLTLGTGIGFALIINGKLYQGTNGLIEGGHMIVRHGGASTLARLCACGQRGCAEVYASATNVAKRFKELENTNTVLGSKDVFKEARRGNANAKLVLNEAAECIAILCINICRVVDPEVIIFAGGMSKAGEDLLQLVRKHMHELSWTVLPTHVELATAHAVDHAGSIGAALAAKKAFVHEVDAGEEERSVKVVASFKVSTALVLAALGGGGLTALGMLAVLFLTKAGKGLARRLLSD